MKVRPTSETSSTDGQPRCSDDRFERISRQLGIIQHERRESTRPEHDESFEKRAQREGTTWLKIVKLGAGKVEDIHTIGRDDSKLFQLLQAGKDPRLQRRCSQPQLREIREAGKRTGLDTFDDIPAEI